MARCATRSPGNLLLRPGPPVDAHLGGLLRPAIDPADSASAALTHDAVTAVLTAIGLGAGSAAATSLREAHTLVRGAYQSRRDIVVGREKADGRLRQRLAESARVGQAETAFGLRTDHLLVEIVGAWAPEDAEAGYGDWADQTSQRLAPLALPGGYPNLLGADEPEGVPPSFGPNYERLVSAKRRYDPDNIFTSAVPTLAV